MYIYFGDSFNELYKCIIEYTTIGREVIKTSVVLNLKYNSGCIAY
jgi:hypothetical protein